MKNRIVFKSIFLFFLIIILIGLIFIIFDKAGTRTGIYMPKPIDYRIEYDSEVCLDALEEIYSDSKYTYSLPCISSSNIKIVWEDGITDPLMFAIEKEKVTMESLEEHGLKIYKNEK